MQIQSQVSLNIPLSDKISTASTTKAMEDARGELYKLSSRECATLKEIYGGECTVTAVNLNSSVQERSPGVSMAFVSISNTYLIKKSPIP